jgi:acetyl-CoA C-acetyltransferase
LQTRKIAMETPVVLSACRTPIGRFRGSLSSLAVTELGATAVNAAVQRSGLPSYQVDEVIMGNVLSAGAGQAPARQAALRGGLPADVAALTINKVCGSGLKSVMLAAQAVRCGDATAIVAGGMESMSRSPYLVLRSESKAVDRTLIDSMLEDGLRCADSGQSMGQIAEQLAADDQVSRLAQDQFACESHARATAAAERGDFDDEIVPVVLKTSSNPPDQSLIIQKDEGPRSDTTMDGLAKLAGAFETNGTVTAGNASMISDGAAAVVVTSQRFASQQGLKPLARIVAYATSGTQPSDLFLAPVAAIGKVLKSSGLNLDDIGLIEINEAFAVQMLACMKRLELSAERLNVHGGAIALGHPIGASGARVLTTLIHALRRRDQQLGLASLCLGGGNAVAMIVERI